MGPSAERDGRDRGLRGGSTAVRASMGPRSIERGWSGLLKYLVGSWLGGVNREVGFFAVGLSGWVCGEGRYVRVSL